MAKAKEANLVLLLRRLRCHVVHRLIDVVDALGKSSQALLHCCKQRLKPGDNRSRAVQPAASNTTWEHVNIVSKRARARRRSARTQGVKKKSEQKKRAKARNGSCEVRRHTNIITSMRAHKSRAPRSPRLCARASCVKKKGVGSAGTTPCAYHCSEAQLEYPSSLKFFFFFFFGAILPIDRRDEVWALGVLLRVLFRDDELFACDTTL